LEVTNMTTKKAIGTVALALALGGAGIARAGNPPPPKEVQGMSCLVGNWKGTGSMTMGAQKVEGIKMTWDCKKTSGDWGVSCHATMVGMPGLDKYEESDLFGYDAGTGKYHWYSVTNAGEVHDHVSTPSKPPVLEFVHNGLQEGKPYKEVVQITFKGKNDSITDLHVETFVDGKLESVLNGTAHK
jgi:hypothetical protein